jgi:hypothetical protein
MNQESTRLMMDSPTISNLVATWDATVADVLSGRATMPVHLEAWLRSLRNVDPDASRMVALPEPFLGRMDRRPAGVFLTATPGPPFVGSHGRPDFQSLTGVFAREINDCGSYSTWATSWAYLRKPWTSLISPRGIHQRRLQFLRHWHGDDRLRADHMVTFALFPWHTTGISTRLRPDVDLLQSFVFDPILELGPPPVFTFGSPWFTILPGLGFSLEALVRVGEEGAKAPTRVRTVALFQSQKGLQVIAEKHPGTPYPPPIEAVTQIQKALANVGVPLG